jgi:hypothetical protein
MFFMSSAVGAPGVAPTTSLAEPIPAPEGSEVAQPGSGYVPTSRSATMAAGAMVLIFDFLMRLLLALWSGNEPITDWRAVMSLSVASNPLLLCDGIEMAIASSVPRM